MVENMIVMRMPDENIIGTRDRSSNQFRVRVQFAEERLEDTRTSQERIQNDYPFLSLENEAGCPEVLDRDLPVHWRFSRIIEGRIDTREKHGERGFQ